MEAFIQGLMDEVDELREKVNALKDENADLRGKLGALRSRFETLSELAAEDREELEVRRMMREAGYGISYDGALRMVRERRAEKAEKAKEA